VPGRADRRHERGRDPRHGGARPTHRPQPDDPDRGARHGGRDGPGPRHHGPELRRGAGRGDARRDPGRPARPGGLSQDLMLVLDNVNAHYGKSHVLHGVSIEVRAGEVVGLIGRNGVGKTTTLKAVMGLVRRTGGRITFDGRDLHGVPTHRLATLGIAWVPEESRIFRLLTVLENLRTGLDRPGLDERKRQELLEKVYQRFPVLRERRNQAGGTLSGGEQQMLAIARAMMLEPKIILLDEPTEGLMPRMVSQIREIVHTLHREGVAILLVEQNVPLTLEAAER